VNKGYTFREMVQMLLGRLWRFMLPVTRGKWVEVTMSVS
jgi:hypothetical protein